MNADLQKMNHVRAFTCQATGIARELRSNVSIFYDGKKYVSENSHNAIWDTGASGTVINHDLANELGLMPVSKSKVLTANGEYIANIYLVSLVLPNNVIINNLQITDGNIGQDIEFLIGMDVITKGDFAVSNHNGRTAFTFRIPSVETTDYVKQCNNKQVFIGNQSVGKKSKCPCGSGKQYKDCCGKR